MQFLCSSLREGSEERELEAEIQGYRYRLVAGERVTACGCCVGLDVESGSIPVDRYPETQFAARGNRPYPGGFRFGEGPQGSCSGIEAHKWTARTSSELLPELCTGFSPYSRPRIFLRRVCIDERRPSVQNEDGARILRCSPLILKDELDRLDDAEFT